MNDMGAMMLAKVSPLTTVLWILLGLVGLVVLVGLLFLARFIKLWLQAYFANAGVRIFELVGMAMRKVNPHVIVLAKIRGVQAGLDVIDAATWRPTTSPAGTCRTSSRALIAANRANIDLSWQTATAIDLAGRDILDAVQTSVNPKVIDCPNPKPAGAARSTRSPRTASRSRPRPA